MDGDAHGPTTADDIAAVLAWYDDHGRDLPWRGGVSAWAVLVSEIMSQQTPVARVEPAWRAWLDRWPDPEALARASPADVLAAWGTLGYPRRALRLQECARAVVEQHGGRLPTDEEALFALPGVGPYTAAAVLAFAFERRSVVLDTNVRRVLARWRDGRALPPPHLSRAEWRRAAELVPDDDPTAARWAAASMELGALVCTARSPACDRCPIAASCAWLAAGRPADEDAHLRRRQPFTGTDRELRGRVMARLRAAHGTGAGGVDVADLLAAAGAGADAERARRVLDGLVSDGLVELDPPGAAGRLPRAR